MSLTAPAAYGYSYKGYTYLPQQDVEEDNIKIWHEVKAPEIGIIHIDCSPYRTPTVEQFHRWVDAGCPAVRLEGV